MDIQRVLFETRRIFRAGASPFGEAWSDFEIKAAAFGVLCVMIVLVLAGLCVESKGDQSQEKTGREERNARTLGLLSSVARMARMYKSLA